MFTNDELEELKNKYNKTGLVISKINPTKTKVTIETLDNAAIRRINEGVLTSKNYDAIVCDNNSKSIYKTLTKKFK